MLKYRRLTGMLGVQYTFCRSKQLVICVCWLPWFLVQFSSKARPKPALKSWILVLRNVFFFFLNYLNIYYNKCWNRLSDLDFFFNIFFLLFSQILLTGESHLCQQTLAGISECNLTGYLQQLWVCSLFGNGSCSNLSSLRSALQRRNSPWEVCKSLLYSMCMCRVQRWDKYTCLWDKWELYSFVHCLKWIVFRIENVWI